MTKDKLHAVEQLQAHETNNVALAQELASLRTESSSNVKSFEERLKLASEAMMHKVTMEKYEAIHTLDQELCNIQVEKYAISVTLSQLRQDYRRLLEEMLAYKEREENAKEREEKGKELAAELHNAVLRLVDEKKAIAQRHDLQRRENNKITRELLQTVQQQEAQLKALGAERESEVKGKHALEVQCRKLSEENQRYEHEFGQMAQKSKSNKDLADKHEQVAAKLAMERDRLLKEYHSAMQREGVVSKALDDANNTLAPLKSEYHVVKSHKDALQEELNKLKAEVLLFKDRDSIAANRLQQRDVTIANLKQEMAETHEREAARSSAFKEVQAAFEQQEQLLRAVTAERDAEAERSRQLADQVRELKLMTSSATQTLDTGRRQMVEELSAIHKQVHALTLEKQRSLDAFNELAREKAAQSERSMRLYEEQRQLVLQAEERARNLVEEKLVVEKSLAALKQGVLTLQAQSQRQHDEDLAAREVLERKVDELSQHAAMQAEALGKTEAAYESRLRILKEAKGMDEETERRLAQLIVERDRAMAGLQLLEGKSLTLGEELAAAHAREAMAQQLATDKLRAMGKHLEEKDYDIQQLEATQLWASHPLLVPGFMRRQKQSAVRSPPALAKERGDIICNADAAGSGSAAIPALSDPIVPPATAHGGVGPPLILAPGALSAASVSLPVSSHTHTPTPPTPPTPLPAARPSEVVSPAGRQVSVDRDVFKARRLETSALAHAAQSEVTLLGLTAAPT